MRRMVRLLVAIIAVASGLVLAAAAAAPVTPSYQGVERTIQAIRQVLGRARGLLAQPNRAGLGRAFRRLAQRPAGYGKAAGDTDRVAALDHIYQISEALGTTAWQPAANLREEAQGVAQAQAQAGVGKPPAERNGRGAAGHQSTPTSRPTENAGLTSSEPTWEPRCRNTTRPPPWPSDRRPCDRIHESLGTLSAGNQKQPWWPSSELEAAVNDLFNRPNLDIAADVEHGRAALQRQSGPERAGRAQRLCLSGHGGAQNGFRSDARATMASPSITGSSSPA